MFLAFLMLLNIQQSFSESFSVLGYLDIYNTENIAAALNRTYVSDGQGINHPTYIKSAAYPR